MAADREESAEEEKRHRRIETQAREILRTERRILSVADFMALLMVAATTFTALATWRTYKVSELIFAISDRPFLGVQQVTFERVDTAERLRSSWTSATSVRFPPMPRSSLERLCSTASRFHLVTVRCRPSIKG